MIEYSKRKDYFRNRYLRAKSQKDSIASEWQKCDDKTMEWKALKGPIHAISLGAGVQSSTMALMASKGEIQPMPSFAIFADTQCEPKAVYEWLEWLKPRLAFPVYVVTAGSLAENQLRIRVSKKTGKTYAQSQIPAYVKSPDSLGLAGRSCTTDYKVKPLLRKLRELRNGSEVVSWIGISADEAHRMKPSLETWAKHRWPLVELNMKRSDCLAWMSRNGFPQPPRSSCVFCPFHSDEEWRKLTADELKFSAEFERKFQAVHANPSVDNKLKGVPFLHRSCKPIDQVEFSNHEKGQSLWGNECEGMCGV